VTLRSRIAWTAGVATAFVAIVISAVAIVSVRHGLREQVDQELLAQARGSAARASIIGARASDRPRPPTPPALPIGPVPAGRRPWTARLLRADGSIVFDNEYPDVPVTRADRRVASGARSNDLRDATAKGISYRVVTVHVAGTTTAAQVTRPTTEIDHTVSTLTWILVGCGVGGALGALLIGWLVARAAVRPVTELAEAASHVADTEDLSVEVPETGGQELEALASSFNRMLRTLDRSRSQQRQFVSDASHELRTPLTSLRTNLEVLASGAGLGEADRVELLADVEAQIEELSELVSGLVALARGDEEGRAERVALRWDEAVARAVERAGRRDPRVRIDASLEPTLVVGDAELVERATLNVLDNAIKWSPPGACVDVRLHDGTLVVRDEGPGIAVADRPHVFERFWRAESARSARGSGLGLAIVWQVVAAHGGAVTVDSPDGRGTVVEMRLPVEPWVDADGAVPSASNPTWGPGRDRFTSIVEG
jgi:two-component system sensor histidine kinase MprB